MLFLEFNFKMKLYWPFVAQMGRPFASPSSICLPSEYLPSLRMKEKANGLGFGEEHAMGLIKDGSITQFFLFSFGKSVAGGERKCEKEEEVSIF